MDQKNHDDVTNLVEFSEEKNENRQDNQVQNEKIEEEKDITEFNENKGKITIPKNNL